MWRSSPVARWSAAWRSPSTTSAGCATGASWFTGSCESEDDAMLVRDLPTPHLLLDRRRLERNQTRMRARAAELGVRLRPHGKTATSAEVPLRPAADGPAAITVSPLHEPRNTARE